MGKFLLLALLFVPMICEADMIEADDVPPAVRNQAVQTARKNLMRAHRGYDRRMQPTNYMFSYVGRECSGSLIASFLPGLPAGGPLVSEAKKLQCRGQLRTQNAVDTVGRRNRCKDLIYISENCTIQARQSTCPSSFAARTLDDSHRACVRGPAVRQTVTKGYGI